MVFVHGKERPMAEAPATNQSMCGNSIYDRVSISDHWGEEGLCKECFRDNCLNRSLISSYLT